MKALNRKALIQLIATICFALLVSTRALAEVHLWDITEVYTNDDGTIQFIEFFTTGGIETQTDGVAVTSSSVTNYTMTGNLSGNTSNHFFLIATSGFASIPNAVTPDFVMPNNFIAISGGDTLKLASFDTFTFGAGLLPTDGLLSLNRNLTPGTNSPTNFNGDSDSIDLSTPPIPPLDPDDVYVKFDADPGGSGASAAPLNTLLAAVTAANENAVIHIDSGASNEIFIGGDVISKALTLLNETPESGIVTIGPPPARTEVRSGFRSRPTRSTSSESSTP